MDTQALFPIPSTHVHSAHPLESLDYSQRRLDTNHAASNFVILSKHFHVTFKWLFQLTEER